MGNFSDVLQSFGDFEVFVVTLSMNEFCRGRFMVKKTSSQKFLLRHMYSCKHKSRVHEVLHHLIMQKNSTDFFVVVR